MTITDPRNSSKSSRPDNCVAVLISGVVAYAAFDSNGELQIAFDAVRAVVPQRWAERGRVAWTLLPIDENYGDLLERGYVAARWDGSAGGT